MNPLQTAKPAPLPTAPAALRTLPIGCAILVDGAATLCLLDTLERIARQQLSEARTSEERAFTTATPGAGTDAQAN